MPEETITVLLVNDHSLFRYGVKKCLERSAPHVSIIDEAGSFGELFEKLQQISPDVLITDDQMPGGEIFGSLERISNLYPDLKIIITSFHSDISYFRRLMPYIHGLLSPTVDSATIGKAVDAVHFGGLYFCVPKYRMNK